jgi:ectoine hydroxylase-related dioxygenase (phytanoyl-CoA dioxygenase family)
MQKNQFEKMAMPWVESPFFADILKKKTKNLKLEKIAKFFNKNGYVIIDLGLKKKFIKKITDKITYLATRDDTKKNPDIYHYNESPRILEAFKKSNEIKKLCLNNKIISVLKFFYEQNPVPINSINFIRGTDQPIHSDYIHFSSYPHKYLAAAWIALEKTDDKNGPLVVVPGSHKLDIVDYGIFNLKTPNSMKELSKFYSLYEKYVEKLIKVKGLKKKVIKLKPGQALLWAANLLHGGKKIINKKRTRFSQVIHYHFDKCKFIYNPGFSNLSEGKIALRNLKTLRIL